MTRFTALRLALATVATVCSFGAFAADSAPLTVSASVSGVCKLTAVPAMSFALDPSATTNGTSSSAVTYKCTKGTAPTTFSVGGSTTGTFNGTLTGISATPDTIAYAVTWTNPTGAGTGFGTGSTATTVTLGGTILNANYVNVKADTYNGSATVAINP